MKREKREERKEGEKINVEFHLLLSDLSTGCWTVL